MSRYGKWIGGALALAALGFAAPLWAQTGGLTGKTIQQDGTPCVKCPVIIERQDVKGRYPVKTDKKGEYTYIGLPIGRYKITLENPSGQVPFYITKNVDVGDPTEVDFDLPKEVKQQQVTPEALAQKAEQEKEQKQMTSLKQVFDQGTQLYNDKKYAEAAAAFEQGIPLAKDKNLLVVKEHLADSYREAKSCDKAVPIYQDLITAVPTASSYHIGLGSCYVDMGKSADAQAEYEKAAALDPAHAAQAYFNVGVVLFNAGKIDEAAVNFKKATEADPNDANAFALLGRSLMQKLTASPDGKTVTAPPGTAEAWQTYLKLAPSGPYAQEAQADLQVIHGSVQTEFKKTKKKG